MTALGNPAKTYRKSSLFFYKQLDRPTISEKTNALQKQVIVLKVTRAMDFAVKSRGYQHMYIRKQQVRIDFKILIGLQIFHSVHINFANSLKPVGWKLL